VKTIRKAPDSEDYRLDMGTPDCSSIKFFIVEDFSLEDSRCTLVGRIDRIADLLRTNRTHIIRNACIAYLKNMEIGAKKPINSKSWLIYSVRRKKK
jgi:hypothetical protein